MSQRHVWLHGVDQLDEEPPAPGMVAVAIDPASARQEATTVISLALGETGAPWMTTCCPPESCIHNTCAVIHALIAARLLLPDVEDLP